MQWSSSFNPPRNHYYLPETFFIKPGPSKSNLFFPFHSIENKIDGSVLGPLGIKADDLTDAVWDYILTPEAPLPTNSVIPKRNLDLLKNEFNYFYPMDLRVSGKDLVGNHLSFCIYNHVALFPEHHWPKAFRVNGHLLLNSEKMSKSSGNFMSLRDSINEFGADSTRFTLATSGDYLDDANFLNDSANSIILRLYTQFEWIRDTILGLDSLRTGPLTWNDRVFEAEMNHLNILCKKDYEAMMYRDALRSGFFEYQTSRDWYRDMTNFPNSASNDQPERMHRDLIVRFIESSLLMLAPICPHYSEWIWINILKKVE